MSIDLFGIYKSDDEIIQENISKINGLKVYPSLVTKNDENQLISKIDENAWLTDLKRRVQHYGYKYDYRARKLDHSYYLGVLPYWINDLSEKLLERKIIDFIPDQAIINEYLNDQGIAPHIDCEPCFGDTIISLSLCGACVFNFQKSLTSKDDDKIPILLNPGTLVVMTGESRFKWLHGIASRKTDKFNGRIIQRKRRVSITLRKVIL
jgi:alkylated DNA repair dioxygenase AlkB